MRILIILTAAMSMLAGCSTPPPSVTHLAAGNPNLVIEGNESGWPVVREVKFHDASVASLNQLRFCMVQEIPNDSVAPVTDAAKNRIVMPGTGAYHITVLGTGLKTMTKFTMAASASANGTDYAFRNISVNSGYGYNSLNASEEASMHVDALYKSLEALKGKVSRCIAE